MPIFTIETAYRIPVYRHGAYEADTIEEACRRAIEDDDWSGQKFDDESAGGPYVSGIWQGADAAYRGRPLPFPSQFDEVARREADYVEMLLGVLKILVHASDLTAPDLPFWLPRARTAIAKAEAILAGAPDPARAPNSVKNQTHVLVQLEETRVRDEIALIIEADPTLTRLTAAAIGNADIHAACLAVAAESNLSEERGAAEFHAALAAIREAERRQAASA